MRNDQSSLEHMLMPLRLSLENMTTLPRTGTAMGGTVPFLGVFFRL